jgi:hypothetical protein
MLAVHGVAAVGDLEAYYIIISGQHLPHETASPNAARLLRLPSIVLREEPPENVSGITSVALGALTISVSLTASV